MVTPMMIPRSDRDRILNAPGWTLIYGRRKVGKTFLTRSIHPKEMYLLILRGGGAILENAPLQRTDDASLIQNLIIEGLKQDRIVIVDEFHRLSEDFLERMQIVHPQGKLILLGSSFHVSRKLLSKGSPVLGLFSAVMMSIIDPLDITIALSERFGSEEAISMAPYMRDPWTIRFAREDPVLALKDVLDYSKEAVPALVGESFVEEGRFLSEVYEGIIRSLARGRTTLAEISDTLHSMKLIARSDPSLIRQYVHNMEAMDLIERTPIYKGTGNRYSLRSKIMELHYYIDEKYGIDRDMPLPMEGIIRERIPRHVESFCGELLASLLDGTYRYHAGRNSDIDIIITRKNKPILVGEVKWGSKISGSDIDKFLESTSSFDCRKVIITKNRIRTDSVENLTADDLVDLAKKKRISV